MYSQNTLSFSWHSTPWEREREEHPLGDGEGTTWKTWILKIYTKYKQGGNVPCLW